MQIQIQVKGLPGSSKLRQFSLHKLDIALSRLSHAIQDVTMQLSDINGPDRSGADKLCRVILTMKNSSIVIIEELGADIVQVIERMVARLEQNVSRQLLRFTKNSSSRTGQRAPLLA